MDNQVVSGRAACEHQAGDFVLKDAGCMPAMRPHADGLADGYQERLQGIDVWTAVRRARRDKLYAWPGQRNDGLLG